MNMQIVWKGKRKFDAVGDSGHRVTMDAKPDAGGEDQGPRPMEMLLMGLGGCTGIDIVMILEKMRYNIDEFDIQIQAERAETYPQRFTKIHLHYRLKGEAIPPEKVERAIRLSAETYCSAAASLNASLSHSFELNGVQYSMTTP
jgi:putative redox protein